MSITTNAAEVQRRRSEFEETISRLKQDASAWIEYAQWEASHNKDIPRSRSIWERALDSIDHLKYIGDEMSNINFLDFTKTVLERQAARHPDADRLWHEYARMEESHGDVDAARAVFERWLTWLTDQQWWICYVEFELRNSDVSRARAVMVRVVEHKPTIEALTMLARFEERHSVNQPERVRFAYKRAASEAVRRNEEADELFAAYAEYLELQGEIGGARELYKFALGRTQGERQTEGTLHSKFSAFERRHG